MASFLDWDFKWTDSSLGSDLIKKMNKHQRVNYFIGISSIARKNLLMINLYTMRKYFPDQYDFFPETFLFPTDSKKIIKFQKDKNKENQKLTFIVKPQASCQGRGIYLCQHFSQIDSQSKSIVQQYISNPMLYDGLKFDFRVYVMLKNIYPLEIYLYKQGLVRFATQKYEQPSKTNIDDLCLHLTNYAINKHSPKYEFNQTISNLNYGHKKSLAQFFKSLSSLGCNPYRIWRQIKQCVIKTIVSVQPHLHSQYRKAQPKNQSESLCYQILGFDFMMNSQKKVYLLQVNQSPSFSTETPLDFLVKNFLIKDTLKIVMHDKEKKRINLQFRSKKGKTQQNQDDSTYPSIDEIPANILGNYERIFPASDFAVQKMYEQMLMTIKADYHKAYTEDISKDFSAIRVLSPQLKIKARKEKLFKSIHLQKRQNYIKQRVKLLTISNDISSPNLQINENRKRILSLRKKYILSTSLNKSIMDTSSMLENFQTIHTTDVKKKTLERKIHQNLPALNDLENQRRDKGRAKKLNQINVSTEVDNLAYLSQNFISLKKSHEIPTSEKTQVSAQMMNRIKNQERYRSSITKHYGPNISSHNRKYDFEKGSIRDHLKKYIHFLNPLEKAACHRIEMEDGRLASEQESL